MVKNKILVKILTALTISGFAFSLSKCTNLALYANGIKDVQEYSDVMLTTPMNNAIVKHKLNDNPIAVVVEDLDEDCKKIAIESIKKLDNISKNINYVILDKDDVSITQKIRFYTDEYLIEKHNAAGMATFSYDTSTGVIKYPIDIVVDSDCADIFSTESNESMLSSVIKHEMLHTLGFKDIYDEEDKYNSIMYYNITSDDRALNYTEQDEYYIKKIYDNYVEEVTYPTMLKVEYVKNKENDDDLTM